MSDVLLKVVIPDGVEPLDVITAVGKAGVNDHIFITKTRELSVRLVDGDVTQADLDAAVTDAVTRSAADDQELPSRKAAAEAAKPTVDHRLAAAEAEIAALKAKS